MDERAEKELKMLIEKRWDPVRGVGKTLGTLRHIFIVLFGISIGIGYLTGFSFLFIFFAIPLTLCFVQPAFLHQGTVKRAKKHDWFLCPWCRYSLVGLDDTGVCPECGAGYRRDVCVKLYQCAYKSYQPDAVTLKKRESKLWREAIELRDGVGK